jgi:hypothetical protein
MDGSRAVIITPKTVLYAQNGRSYYFNCDSIFSEENIEKIEEMKNAIYVWARADGSTAGWQFSGTRTRPTFRPGGLLGSACSAGMTRSRGMFRVCS